MGKQLRGMFNADKGEFDLHMINLLIPNTHIIISLVHTSNTMLKNNLGT